MPDSGVQVDDSCLQVFEGVKTKHTYRYALFVIDSSNTKIIPGECGDSTKTYKDFEACFKNDAPCYAVFDFEYDTPDGKRGKMLFVSWIPDQCKVRQKMIYASSKEALKTKIEGGLVEIQATDKSEIDYEAVLAKVKLHSS